MREVLFIATAVARAKYSFSNIASKVLCQIHHLKNNPLKTQKSHLTNDVPPFKPSAKKRFLVSD